MVEVRRMRNEDADEVYRLMRENDNEFSGTYLPDSLTLEQLKRWIDSDEIMLIGKDGKKTVGIITTATFKATEYMIIENFYVIPEYRKNGIGTALYKRFIEELDKRKINVRNIGIYTTDNSLIKFCIREGFVEGKKYTYLEKRL